MNSERDIKRANARRQDTDRSRFGGLGLVIGVTVGAISTISVAAYAVSITIAGGTIGTSAATQTACSNAAWTFNSARTRYVAASNRYEIESINIDNVASPTCRTPRVNRITVKNVATPNDPVGNGNAAPNDGALLGNFAAVNNVETWTSGQGPLLNNISSLNPNVTFVVVVRGP